MSGARKSVALSAKRPIGSRKNPKSRAKAALTVSSSRRLLVGFPGAVAAENENIHSILPSHTT
jgi:hypothetical protein